MRDRDVFRQVETLRGHHTAMVSPSALDVHTRVVAHCRRESTGYVSDADLDGLTAPRESTMAAVELCLVGAWHRTDGGYVVIPAGRASGWRRLAGVGKRVWAELNSGRFIP